MVTLKPDLATGHSGAQKCHSQCERGVREVQLPEFQSWVNHLPVTLSKLPNLSKSQFPHLKMEIIVLIS